MAKLARVFFSNLFKSQALGEDMSHLLSDIYKRVSEANNSFLTAKYTKEEVRSALKEMGPLKAPSCDDFPTLFFQKF